MGKKKKTIRVGTITREDLLAQKTRQNIHDMGVKSGHFAIPSKKSKMKTKANRQKGKRRRDYMNDHKSAGFFIKLNNPPRKLLPTGTFFKSYSSKSKVRLGLALFY